MTAPVIAVNPAYNLFLNNMGKTVLLSQLVYWDARKVLQRWGECWIVKTSATLADEICHGSAKSVGDWLREFKQMGLIRVKRGFFEGINQLWIQVNQDKIRALLAESTPDSNLPESDIPATTNLPQTDSPTAVSYPTGNCISKITSKKIDDPIEDDIFKILSQEQINTVTERVTAQINSRKITASPIRNPERYLRVSLENEARHVQPQQAHAPISYETDWDSPKVKDINDVRFGWQDAPKPKPHQFPTDAIWDAVVTEIEAKWDKMNFDTWIKPIRFMEKTDDLYIIATPNVYLCDMLQYRLYDDIKTALCEITQRDLEIEFRLERMM